MWSPPTHTKRLAISNSPSSHEIKLNEISEIPAYFVALRAVHFAGCLLAFGVCAFDRFIVNSARGKEWDVIARRFMLIALPLALLSGIAWFAAVAIQMSGQPLSMDLIRIVWSQTQFGTVWKTRSILWIITCLTASAFFLRDQSKLRSTMKWLALIFTGLFAMSLAWSGHGQTGRSPRFHLFADILHLLAAGLWPTTLLPLALLLQKMRKASDENHWQHIAELVRRFSLMSVIAVAMLLATGIINSFFLIDHFSQLFFTTYGRVLLLKIILFALMAAIGGINLLILKPRLTAPQDKLQLPRDASQLQLNIWVEVLLGAAVLVIVAILGLLPPALG